MRTHPRRECRHSKLDTDGRASASLLPRFPGVTGTRAAHAVHDVRNEMMRRCVRDLDADHVSRSRRSGDDVYGAGVGSDEVHQPVVGRATAHAMRLVVFAPLTLGDKNVNDAAYLLFRAVPRNLVSDGDQLRVALTHNR